MPLYSKYTVSVYLTLCESGRKYFDQQRRFLMDEILTPIISGLFMLAGVLLSYYLGKERKAKRTDQTAVSTRDTSDRKVQSRQKPEQSHVATTEPSRKVAFFKKPSWWALSFFVLAVSVGAGIFVRWVVEYIFGVFNVDIPYVKAGWIVPVLGGLAWGLAYIWAGTVDPYNDDECTFPVLEGYDDIFNPVDFSDFIRGLMSTLPVNLLLSWIAAIGLGMLSATRLGANFSGVVYLVFGTLTFIGISWFLSEQL